jgi:hypothetical protein
MFFAMGRCLLDDYQDTCNFGKLVFSGIHKTKLESDPLKDWSFHSQFFSSCPLNKSFLSISIAVHSKVRPFSIEGATAKTYIWYRLPSFLNR